MPETTAAPRDPRIRRTRRLLQDALQTLLTQKAFNAISITDICKQADVARVTFYQHYESKEALLLAAVTDFFASFHETLDLDAIDHYFKTGETTASVTQPAMEMPAVERIQLVGIALQHIGSDVRQLSIESFKTAWLSRETELNVKEIEVVVTFYIGGVLTLLDQFLRGELSLTPAEFQATTLPLLRAVRQGMLESGMLRSG